MPDFLPFVFAIFLYRRQQVDITDVSVIRTIDLYIIKGQFRIIERQRATLGAIATHCTWVAIKLFVRSRIESKGGLLSRFPAMNELSLYGFDSPAHILRTSLRRSKILHYPV